MNLAFMRGLLSALDADADADADAGAVLDPAANRCCVALVDER